MKILSSAFFLSLMAAAICFSHAGLAGMKDKQEYVSTLRQAADELQNTNPELAEKLDRFADKKEEWKEKGEEYKEQKQKDLQTLRQAAAELDDDDDPEEKELAGRLDDMAGRWEKKMQEKTRE